MPATDHPSHACLAQHYLRHPPERLALDGYRHWLQGRQECDEKCFNSVRDNLNEAIGFGLARFASEGLNLMVTQLDACSHCPLRFLKPATNDLCREEAFVLGLIASIQNGNEYTAWRCATQLTCQRLSGLLIGAAGQYAIPLKVGGQSLMPFPNEILVLLEKRQHPTQKAKTLH